MKQSLMKSVSGIRGIVGKSLIPEIVLRYSSAFGIFCNKGKVVVGRDTRTSGEMLEKVVFSGLMSVGCNVINVGICPTPTISLMVEKLKSDGGIAITSSHNSAEWNALKFINKNGLFLNEKMWKRLDSIYENNKIKYADWENVGKICNYDSAIENHIEKILDIPYISQKKYHKKNLK